MSIQSIINANTNQQRIGVNILMTKKSLDNIRETTAKTQTGVDSIYRIIEGRIEERAQIVNRTNLLRNRREELRVRSAKEAEIEAGNLNPKKAIPGQKVMSNTGGSFFDRILGFLGWTTVGWIAQNFPVWKEMGENFIKRAKILGDTLRKFPTNMVGIFRAFTAVLDAQLKNILYFDFRDESGRVSAATSELDMSLKIMQESFEDAFSVFDPNAFKNVGNEDDGNNGSGGSTGSNAGAGTGQKFTSKGGTKIEDPGGQDYGYYNPNSRGSRTSTRVHGAGGEIGHTGEDYAMPIGTPLTLLVGGKVVDVEKNESKGGGYGKFVVVQLEDGNYLKLAHMDSINVNIGDEVGMQEDGTAPVLGFSGDTGLSSGPHLHLDYASGYDPSSAMVSGTMNPKIIIESGGLVKGDNVREIKVEMPPAPVQPSQSANSSSTTQTSTPQNKLIPSSGGNYSIADMVQLAKNAGFSDSDAAIMASIAMGESGGDARARYNPDGSTGEDSYGLWQINMDPKYIDERMQMFGISSKEQLFDPATNAMAAKKLWEQQGFGAWTEYKNKDYKEFLPEAQSVVMSSGRPEQNIAKSSQVTPERKGPTVIVDQGGGSQPSMPSSMVAQSQGSDSGSVDPLTMLNNFMKQKLLLDFSYL